MQLLQLEWQKYKSNALFRLIAFSYLLFLPTVLLLGKKISIPDNPIFNREAFFVFPTIWKYLGYVGNHITFILLGFLGIMLVTHEFQYKTVRQSMLNGMSRLNFYWSKVQFMVVIAIVSALYFLIVGVVIGQISTTGEETMWPGINVIFRYGLMSFAYMFFGFVFGLFIRRPGISLICYFGYTYIVEMLIRYQIHGKVLKGDSMNYYPLNAAEDLMPIPIPKGLSGGDVPVVLSPNEAIMITLLYLALFGIISIFWFRRSDL